jgi:hypothetical protein
MFPAGRGLEAVETNGDAPLENVETLGDQNKCSLFSFSWRRKRKKKILEEESKMRGLAC